VLLRRVSLLVLVSVSLAGLAPGSEVPNWPTPGTWTPSRALGVSSVSDFTIPLPFIGITPCRVADTRGNGFTGGYGPPSIGANTQRSFTIAGQCGIPASAKAVSFNFGALNVGGGGDLRVFPAGAPVPLVSTLNYSASTPNIANAAIVPLGTGGAITVLADAVGLDLIIDVNGYYGSIPATAGTQFALTNAVPGGGNGAGVIVGHNTETASANSWGGQFISDSCNAGSAGVFGFASSAPSCGAVYGLWGRSRSVFDGSAGVLGEQQGTSGAIYGVIGATASADISAAGVLGRDGTGAVVQGFLPSSGVRGESVSHIGVAGLSLGTGAGVIGILLNSGSGVLAQGELGTGLGNSSDATGPPWGVFSLGNFGALGAKHFVEPHPADPDRVILYSSLEGREVGTYFRGTARTVGRRAVIDVPEDFRIVTDEAGLTVQLTPVGPLATMSVESEDLNRIVVRSSQEVVFHYLVQGVRRAFKGFEPVARGVAFVPRSADERMPAYLTEEAKVRLIANGTYNPDGTVNMETAERLGWAKAWRDRENQVRARAAAHAGQAPK